MTHLRESKILKSSICVLSETMTAARYRQFLRLLDSWPLDVEKSGRDLGVYLRERIAYGFRQGEASRIENPEQCDKTLNALVRINSNKYKNMYPRLKESSSNGLTIEEIKAITSTQCINMFRKDEGLPEIDPIDKQMAVKHNKESHETI